METGDRVGIGGFIVSGGAPKYVLIRAIGPSLTRFGVTDPLLDPVLELHGGPGFTTSGNSNARDTQEDEIQNTGLPPTNDFESAIAATLTPGAYTAIVRGNGNTSGVALVEVYDLNQPVGKLVNLSTRAFVSTVDVVLAGFILETAVARIESSSAVWPESHGSGFPMCGQPDPGAAQPGRNAGLYQYDWQDNPAQAAELTAAGLAPSNNLEAAIAATLPPNLYPRSWRA